MGRVRWFATVVGGVGVSGSGFGQPAPLVPPRPPVVVPVVAVLPVAPQALPKGPAVPPPRTAADARPLPLPPPSAVPALPGLPGADMPRLPAFPPPSGLAPPAPPANSAPAAQPVRPPGADFSLRPGDNGNSVKPEPPAVPASRPADPAPEPRRTAPPDPDPAATGDAPMTLKQTAAAALFGGALALSQPTPAAGQDKRTVDEKLADIDKKLDLLTQAVLGKKTSDGLLPTPPEKGLTETLRTLNADLAALKADIEGMKKLKAFSVPAPPADPMVGKGTVRIENKYPVEVTVTLNGVNRRVDAGATAEYVVPAGDFTYTLLSGLDPLQQRGTVAEKQTATLRVK